MDSHSTTQHRHYTYMATSPPQQRDEARTLPSISGMYLSPPEETLLDSFSTDASPAPARKQWETKLPPIRAGPSPPVSPDVSPLPRISALNDEVSQHSHTQDPLLYPGSRHDSNAAPLFDGDSQATLRRDSLSPEKKVAAPNRPTAFSDTLDPGMKRILPFVSQFRAPEDCAVYYHANCNELARIPGFGIRHEPAEPPLSTLSDRYTARQKDRLHHSYNAGVAKSRAAPRTNKAPTNTAPMTKPAKTAPSTTSRKPIRAPTVPRDHKSVSVEPQARKRAQPSKGGPPKAEDKNWAQLPDYSPPVSTLDNRPKLLKVTWKGAPNDLSGDPDIEHMHPHEIEVAAELKLPAAQYLANKRRIFQAKLASLREGRTFTKTAAQQACNIDVNKTSQLFVAFERCGWFDKGNFQQWL